MKYIKSIFHITLFSILLVSCDTNSKKIEIEHKTVSKEQPIDNIVNQIDNNIDSYNKIESLRFSKETEQYEAVKFLKNDSVVLVSEQFSTPTSNYARNFYYSKNKIILIREIGFILSMADEYTQYEHNIYYYSDGSSTGFKTNFNVEDGKEIYDDMGNQIFNRLPLDLTSIVIDKNRFNQAFNQEGPFEMKFGEFLIIEPQSYLILENEKSDYDVALYIIEGDSLLDDMYVNPSYYKGKTINVKHEIQTMNGVERLIYKGGELKK
jgi:hypothetical protein